MKRVVTKKKAVNTNGRRKGRILSEKIHAVQLDHFGPPSVLEFGEMPEPRVGANDVLIDVHTAGVGSWDPSLRSGEWSDVATKFPLVLGADGSGTVIAKGARVRRLKVGDCVYAYNFDGKRPGFYAEEVAVPQKNVARIPRGLDLTHAGAAPAIALTALQGVDDALHIKRGENVVILGASGNVGMLAVQFAKQRGARVLAVASGKDGVAFVKKLGADEAIDGKRANIKSAITEFAPDGLDAILAFVGGPQLTQAMDALPPKGRVAYPNGIDPEPRKRKGIKMLSYDAKGGTAAFTRLNRAIEETELQIPIAEEVPLSRAAQAHKRVEKGHVLGRVVLQVER